MKISLGKKAGKKDIRSYEEENSDLNLETEVIKLGYKKAYEIAKKGLDRSDRNNAFNDLREEIIDNFSEEIINHPLIYRGLPRASPFFIDQLERKDEMAP